MLVISPILALAIAKVFDLEPGIATGLVLVAAVPGGTMSNILTYFAKANVPLSIALTAIATTGCLLTTPLVLQIFAGSAVGADVQMPGTRIAFENALFLLLPLALGMMIGNRFDPHRDAIARVFIRISVAAIAMIVIGSGAADRLGGRDYGAIVAISAALFSVLLFAAGFLLLKAGGLPAKDCVAAAIETSYRNISLALLVKASIWPVQAGVVDVFADQVFFVALTYGGIAMIASLPGVLWHRRVAVGA